jgi:signal transduction histidine kinase/Na+/proline symporter
MQLSVGILLVASVIWLGLLFAVAVYGERHPQVLARHWAYVYGLSLAVHCTSWTFYGTVTQASRSGWWLPPTFVGAILLYVLGTGLLSRMVRLAREHNASSLADLIAARLGHHSGLAALATAVMLLGIVPYIALQLQAVAMSSAMLRASPQGVPAWRDSALYVALAMALFAMLFGTRRASAVAHNRGLILAMAFESLFKLAAMLALGSLVLGAVDSSTMASHGGDTRGFPSLILLGALAMFTLPHQFHVGVVECRAVRHLRTARWLFPLYMLLIAAPILPLARLGDARLAVRGVPSDLYVLALPLSQGKSGLALLAFLGGLSAATSMVVVATLALSLMIANHFIAPLRVHAVWGRGVGGDLRGEVLIQRRLAIVAVILLAWIYSRIVVGNDALADIGALSFSALAGLGPATLVAVYWPHLPARAVGAGLAAGTAVWMYTLLPSVLCADAAWVQRGPFDLALLAPINLLGLGELSAVARAVTLNLATNVIVLLLVARPWRGVREASPRSAALRAGELRALAARFLPDERIVALFAAATPDAQVEREILAAVEHELAAVIGASSTRLLLDVAQRDRSGQLDTVAAIVGEASADLRFNQRVLEAALENMSQGICVVDADLRVVAWNRRYAELFAYPPGLLAVGRPVADLTRHCIASGVIGPGEIEARVARRLAHMREGTPHLSERVFPDGSVIEIRGNPMPGGGYVATFSDVTAFRRAEQELTRANETLEQRVAERTAALAEATRAAERANETKSRFLAAVSHDLMQPLHAAQLFAHTLRARLDPRDAETARHLEGALCATESLLGSLLDIARLDGGRLQAAPRAVALADVLGPLAAEFRALAAQDGLRLDVVTTRAWVRSDPHLLRRVLQNFLANALRYAERGRVVLGCRRRGGHLRIEVWDTGPGIAPEEQHRIFEEFRRGSAASGQGLGLGLAIAERIAHLLGHTIGLRSWPGRGSVFWVAVPLVSAQSPPPDVALAVPSRGRALIVDNEPQALAALQMLLEGWGWTVVALRDAQRAPMQAREVDIAILDYHLDGGRTGLQLYAAIRATVPLPTIILTADRDEALRQRILGEGLTLLYKPLKPLALHQALSQLVRPRAVA